MKVLAWYIVLACGAALAATAVLPSWAIRGAHDARPIAVPAFLGGHVIGAAAALVAIVWIVGTPRAALWAHATVAWLAVLSVGLILHLAALDCFQHHGRSPDLGVTTPFVAVAVAAWWIALLFLATGPSVEPPRQSGRIVAASAAVAWVWFGLLACGNPTRAGNQLALVAAVGLLVGGWLATDEAAV